MTDFDDFNDRHMLAIDGVHDWLDEHTPEQIAPDGKRYWLLSDEELYSLYRAAITPKEQTT